MQYTLPKHKAQPTYETQLDKNRMPIELYEYTYEDV